MYVSAFTLIGKFNNKTSTHKISFFTQPDTDPKFMGKRMLPLYSHVSLIHAVTPDLKNICYFCLDN